MSIGSTDPYRRPGRWVWIAILVSLLAAVALLVLVVHAILPKAADASRVARRGQTLVKAIERYHHDSGRYPAMLDELVPGYLPFIPHPGLRIDRPYVLRRSGSETDRLWTADLPFAVTVDMAPSGTLVYRPSHVYDDLVEKPPGGRPVGDWYLSYID